MWGSGCSYAATIEVGKKRLWYACLRTRLSTNLLPIKCVRSAGYVHLFESSGSSSKCLTLIHSRYSSIAPQLIYSADQLRMITWRVKTILKMMAPNRCKTLRTARLKGRSVDPFSFELLAHMQASISRKAVRTLHIDLVDASSLPSTWICCDCCKCCECPTHLGQAEVIVQLHIGTNDDITSRDRSLVCRLFPLEFDVVKALYN
jgi:hypothetical protein